MTDPNMTSSTDRMARSTRMLTHARQNPTTSFQSISDITSTPEQSTQPVMAWRPLLAISLVIVAVHTMVNAFTPYGFHRDEFLYMAMGKHLRLWSMDFPPFIAILANFARATTGDSLTGIRMLPALAGGALIFITGALASEMGGGRKAQILSALAVALSPLFIRCADLFQPVVFDQVWWSLSLLVAARLCTESDSTGTLGTIPSRWVSLGIAFGLGLLTKFTVLVLAAALAIALTVSQHRRTWLTRWPWIAGLVALIIGSPSLVGQWRLGYPVAAQMDTLQRTQLVHASPLAYVSEQLLWGPGVFLAFAGLGYLLFAPKGARYRLLGLTCAFSWLLLWFLHGKSYYIGPIYPCLFAAGGVAVESWARRSHGLSRVVTAGWLVLTGAYAVVTFPFTLPILPAEAMARFAARQGARAATRSNHGVQLRLPQDYADMLGWPEQVHAVSDAYRSLPVDQRSRTVIMTGNYGEAGAIDFYGAPLGLPPAISATGSYWFFGPGKLPGETVIAVGVWREDLERHCGTITTLGVVQSEWATPEDSYVPILLCRKPRQSLQQLWPALAGRN